MLDARMKAAGRCVVCNRPWVPTDFQNGNVVLVGPMKIPVHALCKKESLGNTVARDGFVLG